MAALTVIPGKVYSTAEKRYGTGSRGEYFTFPVKSENGHDRITVWAYQKSITPELKDADSAKVTEIRSVTLQKHEFNGKWYQNTNVECALEPVKLKNSEKAFDEFMAAPELSEKEVNDLFGLNF